MNDKLTTGNGETVAIDQVIEVLERTPDKAEVMEALRGLRQDKVKAALDQTVKAASFDLGKVFGEFLLDGKKSECTQDTYRREVELFVTWLERDGLNIVQVQRADVNRFKHYMSERYINNTVRLTIVACSSFWKYMEQERYLNRNPFANIKYPRRQYKKAVQPDQGSLVPVMNDEEYDSIVSPLEIKAKDPGDMVYDRASRESDRRLLPLVHFMRTYGLRIGYALPVPAGGRRQILITTEGRGDPAEGPTAYIT